MLFTLQYMITSLYIRAQFHTNCCQTTEKVTDAAIPSSANIKKKEQKGVRKYRGLTEEKEKGPELCEWQQGCPDGG